MSNLQLFCKVMNVIMSCRTKEQLNTAKRYVHLSQKKLSHEWNMDVINMVIYKEREITRR